MGVDVVSGRGFERYDVANSSDVVIVSSNFARYRWPDEDPLGRTLIVDDRAVEVVGVIAGIREFGLQGSPSRSIYLPLEQWPFQSTGRSIQVVLRAGAGGASTSASEPGPGVRGLLPLARVAVGRVDPNLALADVSTLTAIMSDSVDQFVTLGKILGALAVIALLLAVVGVYASMAYSVARRVPEIGVRIALGASAARVRTMVLRGAGLVVGVGTIVGLGLAFMAAKAMSGFLFGVGGIDPVAFVGVTVLLALVSLAAAWVPARRASSVDPMVALRGD